MFPCSSGGSHIFGSHSVGIIRQSYNIRTIHWTDTSKFGNKVVVHRGGYKRVANKIDIGQTRQILDLERMMSVQPKMVPCCVQFN